MAEPTNTAPSGPNLCDCCEGTSVRTPAEVYNRPGLSALAYRAGTHSQFKQSLLTRLSASEKPKLNELNTRDGDDFAIALLDGWATIADVLTFYQERIANESYLRTATERLSLVHLARLIGYELRPGVAASAHLAFEVEDAVGAPKVANVESGTRVQSLPGQGETPQTFETVESIEARAEWNRLRPRLTEPLPPVSGDDHLYLRGVGTNLTPGDVLLMVEKERTLAEHDERWEMRCVSEARPEADADRTIVRLDRPLDRLRPRERRTGEAGEVYPPPDVYALRTRASLFGHNAPDWKSLPVSLRVGEKHPSNGTVIPGAYAGDENHWADAELSDGAAVINLDGVYSQVVPGSRIVLASPDHASLYRVLDASEETKAEFNITAKTTRLEISDEDIDQDHTAASNGEDTNGFSPRTITVYAQSERLELAEQPVIEPVHGDEIVLDGLVGGLEPGRVLGVSGKRPRVRIADTARGLHLEPADGSEKVTLRPSESLQVMEPPSIVSVEHPQCSRPSFGDRRQTLAASSNRTLAFVKKWRLMDAEGLVGFVTSTEDKVIAQPAAEDDPVVSEVTHVKYVSSDRERTTVTLDSPLRHSYDRGTTTINANVARATHGETKNEVLGSGDAGTSYQSFTLRDSPLTHVGVPTPSGTETTLEVRVDEVEWHEVPTLYGRGPRDRVYVTHTDERGSTTVQFGDGRTGARLPTGQENVRARYRKGMGSEGLVKAGQLSLLANQPLGIRSVTNPTPSSGAADSEAVPDAHRNAPLTILTLDRIVSLQDYEDFARAFAGIAKAHATWVRIGQVRSVLVTVAAQGGAVAGPDLLSRLDTAMRRSSDTHAPLEIESHPPVPFRIEAKIKTDPDFLFEGVKTSTKNALEAAFSFDARSFGQEVALSKVISIIQGVAGVIAVDVDKLYIADEPRELNPRLAGEATVSGAKAKFTPRLLILDTGPDGLKLEAAT